MDRKIKGLTLIEILVIIVFLGILYYIFAKEILVAISREKLIEYAETLAGNLNYIKTQSIISNYPYGFCYQSAERTFIFFKDLNRNQKWDDSGSQETIKEQKIASIYGINVITDDWLLCNNSRMLVFDRRGEILRNNSNLETYRIIFTNAYDQKIEIGLNSTGRIVVRWANP